MAIRSVPGHTPVAPQATAPLSVDEYNFEHFGPKMLVDEVTPLLRRWGPEPGEAAPDFELDDVDGRPWRLSELRGRPVVLIFGSGT